MTLYLQLSVPSCQLPVFGFDSRYHFQKLFLFASQMPESVALTGHWLLATGYCF